MNKIKDFINLKLKTDDKKVKLLLLVGTLAILLIFCSTIFDSKSNDEAVKTQEEINYNEYRDLLEEELVDIISSINGVGKCKVMITLENSSENVYAINTDQKTDDNSQESQDEYVIYDSDNGETPILIKEYFPTVQGVSVVCSGGDDVKIKEKIVSTISALFNIPSNRISVLEINE